MALAPTDGKETSNQFSEDVSMSKEIKVDAVNDENEACEVIELAVEEIELLTKAFNLITDVLENRSERHTCTGANEEKVLLH